MQRRTRLAAASALTATLALATGCSNDAGSGGGGGDSLTLFAITDNKDAYDAIIDQFEAANPGVAVNASYGTGNDFESTLNTQMSGGNGPDLLAVQPGIGNLVSVGALGARGLLADLSDQSFAAQIPDSLRTQTDYDGKTYMYPAFVQPLGAFYNMAAMQETGLSAPTTWTGVLDFCRAASARGKVAYSLGLQDQWVAQLVPYALAATSVYGPTPDWNEQLVDGQATFPDSPWAGVEQQYLDMNDAGCFSADPNGISYENSLLPPANGDALGVVQVGGVLGNLQSKNEQATYDLQALPATDDPSQTRMPASLGVGLGVNAEANDLPLAKKFIDFFSQPEQVNAYVESIGGGLPAIPNDAFEAPATLSTFSQYSEQGLINPFPDTGWPNPQVQNAHLVGIQNMFLGQATPADVLQEMQDAVGQ